MLCPKTNSNETLPLTVLKLTLTQAYSVTCVLTYRCQCFFFLLVFKCAGCLVWHAAKRFLTWARRLYSLARRRSSRTSANQLDNGGACSSPVPEAVFSSPPPFWSQVTKGTKILNQSQWWKAILKAIFKMRYLQRTPKIWLHKRWNFPSIFFVSQQAKAVWHLTGSMHTQKSLLYHLQAKQFKFHSYNCLLVSQPSVCCLKKGLFIVNFYTFCIV